MNKVILTGNMTKDFDYKMTESGKAVGRSSIAVKRDYKNANGEYDCDFIDFVCWGNDANYMRTYSCKGARLEIVGRWQVRDVASDKGNKRYNELVVENINCRKDTTKEVEVEDTPFTYDDAIKNEKEVDTNNFDDLDLPF